MRKQDITKTALVLGGGGFIGGHLARRLKQEGFWVRIVDIKEQHEYWSHDEICHEYVCGDLRDPKLVSAVMYSPIQLSEKDAMHSFDEVYQLAADMGGDRYIFTGDNDANVMHSSALINLNVVHEAVKKTVKRVFYSSSACMYPEHNQLDPDNPNCKESSAYPANPDSEYGWEKLFSERLFLAFNRNYGLDVRVARFHNIFGPQGTWTGGKEKAPAAVCRKVALCGNGVVDIWGDGLQTRSFLYIDECVEAVLRLMRQDEFMGPVNIGSEEMVTINQLTQMVARIAEKNLTINNIPGPQGVRGRNSDNKLIYQKLGWQPKHSLRAGLSKTFEWIEDQVHATT
jgi:nucleoside-diphosphate-sugar epimerase